MNGIQREIDRITNEVNEQTNLISEIAAALEGKTTGGDKNMDMCTVTINPGYSIDTIVFEGWQLGTSIEGISDYERYSLLSYGSRNPVTLAVYCDTLIFITMGGTYGASASDGEVVYVGSGVGIIYRTPSTADTTATVEIEAD